MPLEEDDIPDHFKIGEFVGQGRQSHYCGLTLATISCVEDPSRIRDGSRGTPLAKDDELAQNAILKLQSRRPRQWLYSAVLAYLLVMIPLFMAFIAAFVSPTAGIGCWSGSILLFATLSSFSWVVSLFIKSCGSKMRIVCHVVNACALLFLVFFTAVVLSGATNNCYCNTTWFAYPYSGGYMTFGGFEFVRENYDVVMPCALAATFGFAVALGFFIFEMIYWLKCKHLWKTNGRGRPIPLRATFHAETFWLE
ncbi:hypothetical protein OQA88_5498 [Cercophora sp. LCS_1]